MLLREVISSGYSEICRHLISLGSTIDFERHIKFLFKAAYEGKLEIVKLLHNKGFDLNSNNQLLETPLFHAVKCQSIGVCKYLYKFGASLNVTNIYGENLKEMIKFSGNKLIRDFFIREIELNNINNAEINLMNRSNYSGAKLNYSKDKKKLEIPLKMSFPNNIDETKKSEDATLGIKKFQSLNKSLEDKV